MRRMQYASICLSSARLLFDTTMPHIIEDYAYIAKRMKELQKPESEPEDVKDKAELADEDDYLFAVGYNYFG